MKSEILGIYVDSLGMEESVARISGAIEQRSPLRVVTANPEMIHAARHNEQLKKTINTAGLVTPDGVGVVWAAGYLGKPVVERVTGIDLVENLLPLAQKHGWRIFLLGAKPGIAELAARRIVANYPGIILQTHHGYFTPHEEKNVIEQIGAFKPDLLWAGLGAGKQEFWLESHPGLATVSIGVGGSLDTLAGVTERAPVFIRKCKLEWLYRLCKEPKRIKRQLVLPRFVLKVMEEKHRRKQ